MGSTDYSSPSLWFRLISDVKKRVNVCLSDAATLHELTQLTQRSGRAVRQYKVLSMFPFQGVLTSYFAASRSLAALPPPVKDGVSWLRPAAQ